MSYNMNNINNLLEAYWKGNTSLSQEAELRAYFQSGDVDVSHETYAPLFQHFSNMRDMSTDLEVETVLQDIAKPKASIFSIFTRSSYRMGIAAAMTAVFSVTALLNLQNTSSTHNIVLDEAAETEEALRVTREALAFLSVKIDNSSREVKSGVSKLSSVGIIR